MISQVLYVCEQNHPSLEEMRQQSPVHAHDHIELSVILNGEAYYTIHNKAYTLRKGDLVLFTPNTPHSVRLMPQGHYRDLHLAYTSLPENLSTLLTQSQNGFLLVKLGSDKKHFFSLCDELLLEYHSRKPDWSMMIYAISLQLLSLLYREVEQETSTASAYMSNMGYPDKHKVVAFITDYIDKNYMKDISLELFAKNMYLSQVYISKIFKEETGSSPINYLIKTRLSKAKELLEEQNLPIKIVSGQVGYEDAYHFSKLFKKYYGYAPSDLKKKNK